MTKKSPAKKKQIKARQEKKKSKRAVSKKEIRQSSAQNDHSEIEMQLGLKEGISPEEIDEYLFPRNPKRKKRLKEFIDDDHPIMERWYEWLEHDLESKKDMDELMDIHSADIEFFDPYVRLSNLSMDVGEDERAFDLAVTGYTVAVLNIADKNGDWPEEMKWGFMENRHLMRMIHHFSWVLWLYGQPDLTLQILRRMLRMCPNDNIGVRYEILAIRMGLDPETWDEPFLIKEGPAAWEGLDVRIIGDWFDENSKKFPEEFEWWKKEMEALYE